MLVYKRNLTFGSEKWKENLVSPFLNGIPEILQIIVEVARNNGKPCSSQICIQICYHSYMLVQQGHRPLVYCDMFCVTIVSHAIMLNEESSLIKTLKPTWNWTAFSTITPVLTPTRTFHPTPGLASSVVLECIIPGALVVFPSIRLKRKKALLSNETSTYGSAGIVTTNFYQGCWFA